MANIKNMQMWNTICADARISISKTMLGLRTTATYLPTNSVINAKTVEYSATDGEHLKRVLSTPHESLGKAVADCRLTETSNGNYMAEVCCSIDGAYLAVQLFQFLRMKYEPVTGVQVFEGEDARTIKQLFG